MSDKVEHATAEITPASRRGRGSLPFAADDGRIAERADACKLCGLDATQCECYADATFPPDEQLRVWSWHYSSPRSPFFAPGFAVEVEREALLAALRGER